MNKSCLKPTSLRLLKALVEPGAYAMADPIEEGALLLCRGAGAVSLGGGRFSRKAAEDLVRRDLAAWSAGRKRLRATESAKAHLRRAAAKPADSFREQHRRSEATTIATADGPQRVRVDPEESPLDWLRRRRGRNGAPFIDHACFEAGERLRRDIAAAGLLPSVTARWDAVKVDGGMRSPGGATERMVAAHQRLRHAFVAIGADFADLLLDLCGFLKGLESIERERGWPPRSGKVVVRFALSRLAQHYGLSNETVGPATRRILTWRESEGAEAA